METADVGQTAGGQHAGWIDRLAAGLAIIGGILVCFAALLVSVSVLGR